MNISWIESLIDNYCNSEKNKEVVSNIENKLGNLNQWMKYFLCPLDIFSPINDEFLNILDQELSKRLIDTNIKYTELSIDKNNHSYYDKNKKMFSVVTEENILNFIDQIQNLSIKETNKIYHYDDLKNMDTMLLSAIKHMYFKLRVIGGDNSNYIFKSNTLKKAFQQKKELCQAEKELWGSVFKNKSSIYSFTIYIHPSIMIDIFSLIIKEDTIKLNVSKSSEKKNNSSMKNKNIIPLGIKLAASQGGKKIIDYFLKMIGSECISLIETQPLIYDEYRSDNRKYTELVSVYHSDEEEDIGTINRKIMKRYAKDGLPDKLLASVSYVEKEEELGNNNNNNNSDDDDDSEYSDDNECSDIEPAKYADIIKNTLGKRNRNKSKTVFNSSLDISHIIQNERNELARKILRYDTNHKPRTNLTCISNVLENQKKNYQQISSNSKNIDKLYETIISKTKISQLITHGCTIVKLYSLYLLSTRYLKERISIFLDKEDINLYTNLLYSIIIMTGNVDIEKIWKINKNDNNDSDNDSNISIINKNCNSNILYRFLRESKQKSSSIYKRIDKISIIHQLQEHIDEFVEVVYNGKCINNKTLKLEYDDIIEKSIIMSEKIIKDDMAKCNKNSSNFSWSSVSTRETLLGTYISKLQQNKNWGEIYLINMFMSKNDRKENNFFHVNFQYSSEAKERKCSDIDYSIRILISQEKSLEKYKYDYQIISCTDIIIRDILYYAIRDISHSYVFCNARRSCKTMPISPLYSIMMFCERNIENNKERELCSKIAMRSSITALAFWCGGKKSSSSEDILECDDNLFNIYKKVLPKIISKWSSTDVIIADIKVAFSNIKVMETQKKRKKKRAYYEEIYNDCVEHNKTNGDIINDKKYPLVYTISPMNIPGNITNNIPIQQNPILPVNFPKTNQCNFNIPKQPPKVTLNTLYRQMYAPDNQFQQNFNNVNINNFNQHTDLNTFIQSQPPDRMQYFQDLENTSKKYENTSDNTVSNGNIINLDVPPTNIPSFATNNTFAHNNNNNRKKNPPIIRREYSTAELNYHVQKNIVEIRDDFLQGNNLEECGIKQLDCTIKNKNRGTILSTVLSIIYIRRPHFIHVDGIREIICLYHDKYDETFKKICDKHYGDFMKYISILYLNHACFDKKDNKTDGDDNDDDGNNDNDNNNNNNDDNNQVNIEIEKNDEYDEDDEDDEVLKYYGDLIDDVERANKIKSSCKSNTDRSNFIDFSFRPKDYEGAEELWKDIDIKDQYLLPWVRLYAIFSLNKMKANCITRKIINSVTCDMMPFHRGVTRGIVKQKLQHSRFNDYINSCTKDVSSIFRGKYKPVDESYINTTNINPICDLMRILEWLSMQTKSNRCTDTAMYMPYKYDIRRLLLTVPLIPTSFTDTDYFLFSERSLFLCNMKKGDLSEKTNSEKINNNTTCDNVKDLLAIYGPILDNFEPDTCKNQKFTRIGEELNNSKLCDNPFETVNRHGYRAGLPIIDHQKRRIKRRTKFSWMMQNWYIKYGTFNIDYNEKSSIKYIKDTIKRKKEYKELSQNGKNSNLDGYCKYSIDKLFLSKEIEFKMNLYKIEKHVDNDIINDELQQMQNEPIINMINLFSEKKK